MSISSLESQRIRNILHDALPVLTPEAMAKQLYDIGDSLAAACAELARNPTPDGAEILAARFNGSARFCMQFCAALVAQSKPIVPPEAA